MASGSAVNRKAVVFLSHSSDSNGFTNDLCSALRDAGMLVFRSCNGLPFETGDGQNLSLVEQSNIFIPIFSKGYAANGELRFEELLLMMECQKTGNQKILSVCLDVTSHQVLDLMRVCDKQYERHVQLYGYAPSAYLTKSKGVRRWKAVLAAVIEEERFQLKYTEG